MSDSLGRRAALRAVVWGVLGTMAPALVELATSDWFGAGDLPGLVFFTLLLLLVLVAAGIILARKVARRPAWLGLIIGGTTGIGIGFLWTLGNALLLGTWFGAWSFPVLLCWTTGGGLSLAAAATTGSATSWRRVALESAAYLSLAGAALYVYRPAVVHLRHDQHLTLVSGRIGPSSSGFGVEDSRSLLLPGEGELLARSAIGGSVEIIGGHASNMTEEPRARIFVLLRRPVEHVYRLAQPDGTTVVYIQEDTGFRRFPPDAKVLLDRVVELYPAAPNETRYWVEHAGGARSGGSGIQW